MRINKKQCYEKWIIPKNNNSIIRHKIYVSFVVGFFNKNNDWPTIEQYGVGIVEYLIKVGINLKDKKTMIQHQLFHPIFFNMLMIEEGKVLPTSTGLLFMYDTKNIYLSEEIFHLFYTASFSTGATSSKKEYDNVNPIKVMIDRLVFQEKLTFDQLNFEFHSKINTPPNGAFDNTSSDPKSAVAWLYVLNMLEEANLIMMKNAKWSNFSPNTNSGNNYKPQGFIIPTQKLLDIYEKYTRTQTFAFMNKMYEEFNVHTFTNSNIKTVIDGIMEPHQDKKYSNRSASLQAEWKNKLLMRNSSCFICGINAVIVLIASHIKPYAACAPNERFDVENGLILCSNHDSCFDKGYISFDDNGKLIFSGICDIRTFDLLIDSQVENKIFAFNEQQKKYLKYHQNEIFKY